MAASLAHPQARRLAALQLLAGPLVLASYAYCILVWPEASSLMWGGVPAWLEPFYTAWMFAAAAGYFSYSYVFILRTDPARARFGRWGYGFLTPAYALALIPSALWMPATKWMMDEPNTLRWWLVRLDLFAVAAGSLMLLWAAFKLEPRPATYLRRLALIGGCAFCVQTVLLDALIWTALFPI